MKNKLTTPLLLAASFVFLTGAYGGCGHNPSKRAERMERMVASHAEDALDEIDATDAQKARILGHTRQMTKEALALHKAHQGTKTFLWAEWNAEQPNSERVHSMIVERMADFTKFLHGLADAVIDTHQTLSKTQREALIDGLH